MKKTFKNLLFVAILIATSATVHAQPPNWLTNGNTGASTFKLGNINNYDVKVITNNTTRLIVKRQDGKVGIGTNAPLNPVNQLEVDVTSPEDGIRVVQNGANGINGAAALHLKNNTAGGKMWSLYSLGAGNTTEGSGNFLIQESDDYTVNPISRMIIQKGTGNVGIGTVTPTENLVVSEPAGTVAGTQNFLLVETVVNPFVSSTQGVLIRKDDGQKRGFKLFQDGSDDANSVFKIASFSASSDIDRLTIKRDNGNVGIGITTPAAKLDVLGNVKIKDGTEGAAKVLTSDANGLASWQILPPAPPSAQMANDIADLKQQIADLKAVIASLGVVSSGSSSNAQAIDLSNAASLKQNAPNPFSTSTVINFSLPKQYSSAQIIITNMNGQTIKQANVSGSNSLNVAAGSLASGSYKYSLVVDGKMMDTKQMVITK